MLVSHAPSAIERTCDRVVVFDAGRIDFDGPTAEGLQHYHRCSGSSTAAGATDRTAGRRRRRALRRRRVGRRTVFAPGDELRVVIDLRTARRPSPSSCATPTASAVFAASERFDAPGRRHLHRRPPCICSAATTTSPSPTAWWASASPDTRAPRASSTCAAPGASRSRWRHDAPGGPRPAPRRGRGAPERARSERPPRPLDERPVSLDASPIDTVSASRLVEWSRDRPAA